MFQAWTLGNEFQRLWRWCCSALPPQLLLLEQALPEQRAWVPVQLVMGSTLRFVAGTTLRLRCWKLGATQYAWTNSGGGVVASTTVHCTRHHACKSEIVLQAGGKYQCMAAAPDGRSSDALQLEVCEPQ